MPSEELTTEVIAAVRSTTKDTARSYGSHVQYVFMGIKFLVLY